MTVPKFSHGFAVSAVCAVLGCSFFSFSPNALGAAPEIAHIHPDYAGAHLQGYGGLQPTSRVLAAPHLIMGENFHPTETEVFVWAPPGEEEKILAALARIARGEGAPVPPVQPPDGTRRVEPLVVEGRVVVATVTHPSRRARKISEDVLWVGTGAGFSAPYVLNVAKPFWLSREQAVPGEMIRCFGFGVNPRFRTPMVAFIDKDGNYKILPGNIKRVPEPTTSSDEKMLYFLIPPEQAAGVYEVFLHNTFGGEFGWVKAGSIEIVEPAAPLENFDAREFGAKGDGLADDTEGLEAVLAAALEAGGGVVHLPGGTYRVRHTLRIPVGVILRGENRTTTRILGDGYDLSVRRGVWFSDIPLPLPRSVILLTSNTGLLDLTVDGFVSQGEGGEALIQGYLPEDAEIVENILIRNCVLLGSPEHPEHGTHLFTGGNVLNLARNRNVRIEDSEFRGGITMRWGAERLEVRRNIFRRGGIHGRVYESLLENNHFEHAPKRILFYMRRGSYARFNEMDNYFVDSWPNQPEPFLIHGGGEKTVGNPTSLGADRLTDASKQWEPGAHKDAVVLISAGRGFGQYRSVVDNTGDTLILDRPWLVTPDKESEYVLGGFAIDSAYYANSNNSPGVLSLWLDCINIVVEKYRSMAGGLNVWGSNLEEQTSVEGESADSDSIRYNPSWYNTFVDNWMDGTDLQIYGQRSETSPVRGPALFGTFVVGNKITSPHLARSPNSLPRPFNAGGIRVQGPADFTVIADNGLSFTPFGINVGPGAQNTLLLGNEFQEVQRPIANAGIQTLEFGNRSLVSTEHPEYYPPVTIPNWRQPLEEHHFEDLPDRERKASE